MGSEMCIRDRNEGRLVGELEASEATQERIMDKILSSNDEKEN